MARKQYNNGDLISLTENGCDGCSPSAINGIFCHEQNCPDAWRDYSRKCKQCGKIFNPKSRADGFCDDGCAIAYYD